VHVRLRLRRVFAEIASLQLAPSGQVGFRTLLGLAAVLLTQLPWVPSTNFGGYDEWLILELNSRWLVSVPYAYRPLALIFTVPAALLVRHLGFAAFTLLYAVYAWLSAALVYWLVRRLAPERPMLALLSGFFVLVWAPSDMARLSTVVRASYQGSTFGALLAVAMLLQAWRRQSLPLMALSLLLAFAGVRCYEGVAALLLGAPALLLITESRTSRLWRWMLVWEGVVCLAVAFLALEMLANPWQYTYQLTFVRPDPDPRAWFTRMLWQYSYHLLPLVTPVWGDVLTPAVAMAVSVFVVTLVLLHGRSPAPRETGSRPLLIAAGFGIVLAALGYSVVLVGVRVPTAFRLQFLSGPGIALFLAAAVLLAASWLHGRARLAATTLLAGWVVAVGTSRTLALQRACDEQTYYPRQVRQLSGLQSVVTDVLPHTLIVLLDDGRAWPPAGIGFHHAVQYLYERRAAGWLPGRVDAPYPTTSGPEGVLVDPWPIVRRAWTAPRTLYRYDELIAVRHTKGGDVVLLEAWPPELPPLPPGAVYEPRARLASGPVARSAILR